MARIEKLLAEIKDKDVVRKYYRCRKEQLVENQKYWESWMSEKGEQMSDLEYDFVKLKIGEAKNMLVSLEMAAGEEFWD